MAMDLVRVTGLSHREVNGRLNRLAGVTRITEATLDQLRKRADQAERWLASLSGAAPRPLWVHEDVVCGFSGQIGPHQQTADVAAVPAMPDTMRRPGLAGSGPWQHRTENRRAGHECGRTLQ